MAESIPEKRKFVTTWEGAVNRDGRLPLSAIKVTAFSRNLGGTMEYTLHPLRDGAFLFWKGGWKMFFPQKANLWVGRRTSRLRRCF